MATRTDAVGGRARYRRGEGSRLRRDIIDAAVELLDDTGRSDAVTLRAVARRVGITAPAIYPHFRDPQAILLVVVREEFDRLRDHLRAVVDAAPEDAVARLRAWCDGYLDRAKDRSSRYLTLFGGVWDAQLAVSEETVTQADVTALGRDALADLSALLQDCVDDARSTSSDVEADAVALWVGLHGLAHQRIVSRAFPWPPGLSDRLIASLGHLGERARD